MSISTTQSGRPAPRTVDLPRLLGGTISLVGYPLPMVYAEKIFTALQRGTINTRWRDFADLYPLVDVLDGYAVLAQTRWAAWRRKQQLDDRLPSSFLDVLEPVIAFADAPLTGQAAQSQWDPVVRRWNASLDARP